jgi:hypothetical protein
MGHHVVVEHLRRSFGTFLGHCYITHNNMSLYGIGHSNRSFLGKGLVLRLSDMHDKRTEYIAYVWTKKIPDQGCSILNTDFVLDSSDDDPSIPILRYSYTDFRSPSILVVTLFLQNV